MERDDCGAEVVESFYQFLFSKGLTIFVVVLSLIFSYTLAFFIKIRKIERRLIARTAKYEEALLSFEEHQKQKRFTSRDVAQEIRRSSGGAGESSNELSELVGISNLESVETPRLVR